MIIGNHIGGDVLHNIRIGIYGIEASFRFICDNDTVITHCRHYNIFSDKKPGYHLGTGGKIRIQLRENRADNTPADKVLAETIISKPLEAGFFPLAKFNIPCQLRRGQIYHLVFTNLDTEPDKNHVSVNCMALYFGKTQPFIRPNDLSTLFKSKYNDWQRFKDDYLVPIFSLYNGAVPVLGYGGMESWVREPRTISGQKKVRERFSVKVDTTMTGVSARLGKHDYPGELQISLLNNKKAMTSCKIPQSQVSTILTNLGPGLSIGHNWVSVKFDKPVKIKAGVDHFIMFEAAAGEYEMYPVRDGEQFGFIPLWDNSYAEYTIDGKTWRGWDAWGNPNQKIGKLQVCLETV